MSSTAPMTIPARTVPPTAERPRPTQVVTRPAAYASLPAPTVRFGAGLESPDAATSGGRIRNAAVRIGAYLADDVVLAAPIVVLAAWLGPLAAFGIFAAASTVISFFVALAALGAYERFADGGPSALARWLQQRSAGRRGVWGITLLKERTAPTFALASFLLGGVVTTWLVRYSGRTRGLVGVALASSVVFSVLFAAQWAAIAALFV